MDDQNQDSNPLGKRRLGRGLNSLLGHGSPATGLGDMDEAPVPQIDGDFSYIDVDAIERNPFQPRKEFEPQALAELVDSVTQHGVLQPILVRRTERGLQLIAGERRLIASRKAGLKTIPARIVTMEDQVVTEVAIIENLQRADLNDLEKAQAFHEYVLKYGCTIEELARKLGKDRSTISNTLRLLELPDFVKVAIQQGKISASHGRALLPLEEEMDQVAMCQRIQSESMNVRQTEEAVREKLNETVLPFPATPAEGKSKAEPKLSNHLRSLQDQLRDLVGAKVEFKMKSKDAGKLIIHFGSNDEFERIVAVLRKAS